MKSVVAKYSGIIFLVVISALLQGCLFEYIIQPKTAMQGEEIEVVLAVHDNLVPENNPHKGILGIIAPDDWSFVSANYSSSIGSGALEISPEWADSVELYFPSAEYGSNMKWIVLISDKGYTYQDPVTFTVNLKLRTGEGEGCFNIGYLTTKATSGLLNSGNSSWAPLSFPHPIGIPDSNLCFSPYETRPAPEWNNLLDRKSGWTGADGIYSIPLDESEQPHNDEESKHLLLFSDTFIGEVDSSNRRVNSKIVNNTGAVINGSIPLDENIRFFWGKDSSEKPGAIFIPETPNANEGDWYWLMDGISINDTIYAFALRLNSTGGGGGFGFEVNGVVLLKFNYDDENFAKDVKQFDTPLFLKNEDGEIVIGQAIMPMMDISGNPSPDGYIYIYGPRSTSSGKMLVAARVLPGNISDFNSYQFWNGADWVNDIESCASITSGISQEFSVTPIGNNKYLLVSQVGNDVAVKIGDSPVGPFGIWNSVYKCPEPSEDPDIFVYNAKAHPSLSTSEELLISYNVNSLSLADLINNADIYRPRFIYLSIKDSVSTSVFDNQPVIQDHCLLQNYPNPFNPSTSIEFIVTEHGLVTLKIYNMLGKEVQTLISEIKSPGSYRISFNSSNLASGVYYYQLKSGKNIETKKMILLK